MGRVKLLTEQAERESQVKPSKRGSGEIGSWKWLGGEEFDFQVDVTVMVGDDDG
jgi:hypothetical protein